MPNGKLPKGHAFPPDNYLQHELEASFIYEDTPDQVKSTNDVKKDMEADSPDGPPGLRRCGLWKNRSGHPGGI